MEQFDYVELSSTRKEVVLFQRCHEFLDSIKKFTRLFDYVFIFMARVGLGIYRSLALSTFILLFISFRTFDIEGKQ